jgi:hypothetical protein
MRALIRRGIVGGEPSRELREEMEEDEDCDLNLKLTEWHSEAGERMPAQSSVVCTAFGGRESREEEEDGDHLSVRLACVERVGSGRLAAVSSRRCSRRLQSPLQFGSAWLG